MQLDCSEFLLHAASPQYAGIPKSLVAIYCKDVPESAQFCCRHSIIAEVESSLTTQYAQMPQDELHHWHATLQQTLSEPSDQHHKAKDYLKQVMPYALQQSS